MNLEKICDSKLKFKKFWDIFCSTYLPEKSEKSEKKENESEKTEQKEYLVAEHGDPGKPKTFFWRLICSGNVLRQFFAGLD